MKGGDHEGDDLGTRDSFGAGGLPDVIEPEAEGSPGAGDSELILKLALARTRAGLLGISDGPVRVGRYEIADRVGSGAMGVVYSAHDDQLGRKVAIKILHGDVAKSRGGRTRLVREAQAMAKLSHPNVAHVYEVGYHDDTLFIAMEFIEGQTLRRWSDLALGWRETAVMHGRAGRGLAAAHKAGLIHRDYKPDNVLVSDDGRPRVLDFGLARPGVEASSLHDTVAAEQTLDPTMQSVDPATQSVDLTATGTLLGTPAYMAPEQLEGSEIDARADQYSFCVALFEALYGERPFRAASLSELMDRVLSSTPIEISDEGDVPKGVRAIIFKGLSRDRSDRYATMDELLVALERETGRSAPSGGLKWIGAAVLATAALGGAAILAWGPSDSPGELIVEAPAPAEVRPPDALDAAPRWKKIVEATDLPPTIERPLPGDPTQTTVHRLANGLTIYVAPREHETVVRTRLVVRADYRDERPGQEGVSGLVLGALRSGSERLGTRDFASEKPLLDDELRLIEAVSLERDQAQRRALVEKIARAEESANAFALHDLDNVMLQLGATRMTAWDGSRSILLADVPGNRVSTYLQLCAELMQRPVFRGFLGAVAWTRERSSEFSWTDPDTQAVDRAFAPNTASRDPAAVADNLARLPLAEARDFYETYYRPNNVAIVLVGDVTPGDVLPVIESAFGDWEPGVIPPQESASPVSDEVIRVKGQSPAVTIAWKLPDSVDNWPALDSLLWMLDGPDGVFSTWSGKDGIAYLYPDVEPSYFSVTAGVVGAGGDAEAHKAEAVIREALRRVVDHEVSDEDWNAAAAHREFSNTAWSVSGDVLADDIARSFVRKQPWSSVVRQLSRDGVQREEIEAAARGLVARPSVTVRVSRGRQENPPPLDRLPIPNESTVDAKALGPYAQELVAQKSSLPEPQFLVAGRNYEQRPFGAGNLVLVHRDGPRFVVSLAFDAGVNQEKWSCLALKAKVNDALEDHALAGVYFQSLCGADETELSVTGLDKEFDRTWPLVRAWLEESKISEAAMHRTVEGLLSARADYAEEPEMLAGSLRLDAVMRGRGATRSMPSNAELNAVDPATMAAALDRLRAVRLDLGYVGPRPEEFAKMLPPIPVAAANGVDAAAAVDPAASKSVHIIAVDTPGADRMEVWFSIMQPPGSSARDRLLGRMLMHGAVVPGEGEVRHFSENLQAAMGIRAARPDFATFGFVGPHDELRLVLARGIASVARVPAAEDVDDLRTAVEGMLRQDRLSPEWIPTTVAHWRDLGVISDPLVEEWLSLPSVTHEELVAFSQRLAQTPPVIAIAADRDQIDESVLADYGTVEWLDTSLLLGEPGLDDGVLLGYFARGVYVL